LSVLNQLIKDYPHESFIYLGDTARLPYGTKSPETIIKYATRNLNFLLENYNIKALVVACNSVSTVIDNLKSPVPVFGVIKPGAKASVEVSKGLEIGLWATQATVWSKAYQKEITKIDKRIKIQMVSCPSLVALVEEELDHHPLLPQAFEFYFKKFKEPIDVLILGCTHFPFFKENLKKLYPNLKLIDSSICLSKSLINSTKDLSLRTHGKQELKFLLTDEASSFQEFIKKVFGNKVKITKVDI